MGEGSCSLWSCFSACSLFASLTDGKRRNELSRKRGGHESVGREVGACANLLLYFCHYFFFSIKSNKFLNIIGNVLLHKRYDFLIQST